MSFTDLATSTGLSHWQWIGPENYARIFRSQFWMIILGNTLIYVAVVLAFNVIVGLGVALLSVHMEPKAGGVFRALWLLPRISPSVVYALMWTWAAASPPFGMLNFVVEPFGLEPRYWIQSDPWLIVILINGFVGASFGMLILTSAIKAIPEDLFRAAQYILLTTNGGPGLFATETWSLWAFHTALANYYGNLEFAYGAAMAAILVIMGLGISMVLLRAFRFGQLVAEPRVEVE
jgi:inositol-phosphate transport system permease protein